MTPSYGATRHGLICGYAFEAGASGRALDLEQALAWLQAPRAPGDFVWLHFNLSDAAAETWIRKHLPVAPEFFEALHEGSRSTRIEDADGTLVAVVNDVAYEFSFDPAEIETLWVNVSPHLALTARLHPLRTIDVLRQAVRDGLRFASSLAFLNRLLHDQGDVLVRIVRQATVQVDSVEDRLLQGRLQRQRAELGALRRVLVRLQRLLAPEPGALFRLLRRPPAWVGDEDLDDLRQATEEFSLVIRDAAELQERIRLLQEEIAAQVGEQTNKSVYTLTVVTVLALPINIVAGLLGMNVGGIPLAEHPHGFWVIAAVVVTFTVLAGWWARRRRDD
ncbi:transporter [Curvibacter sp. RS43]|uniref:Transporter n=1 Tax=Curvibacter microcysteis TaxID=3026419 RepID=A0ABT5MJN1_9BURK|nr:MULTISPECIES: transporter [unclassified Curvibacter]MDD0808835.1 transporter [Curvibacter sp. RS43]MDD0815341.1 transporter [Curvibacter sp. HBC28]